MGIEGGNDEVREVVGLALLPGEARSECNVEGGQAYYSLRLMGPRRMAFAGSGTLGTRLDRTSPSAGVHITH